jgi:hypothetical protein
VHGSFAALRMTSKDIKPSAWVLRCTQDDISIQLSRARGTHATQRITEAEKLLRYARTENRCGSVNATSALRIPPWLV